MRLRFHDRRRAPFHLSLDDIGCWRKTGIAWLTANRIAPALRVMRDHIVEALRGLHIVIDERKFMPHVTLARRIEAVVARRVLPPLDWHVGSFALVASVLDPAGVRYDVLKTWPDPGRSENEKKPRIAPRQLWGSKNRKSEAFGGCACFALLVLRQRADRHEPSPRDVVEFRGRRVEGKRVAQRGQQRAHRRWIAMNGGEMVCGAVFLRVEPCRGPAPCRPCR